MDYEFGRSFAVSYFIEVYFFYEDWGFFFVVVPQVTTGEGRVNRRAAILPVRYGVFQYIHDFGPWCRLAFAAC